MAEDALYLMTVAGSRNLGDEMQSLAAAALMPRVDGLIEREALHREPPGGRTGKMILNGWFMDHPDHWPPHPLIRPLITSFHLSQSKRSRWRRLPTIADALLAPANIHYLRAHGPVGARDRPTLGKLLDRGVDAYLSGCLTLTLTRPRAERGEDIVACDLPQRLLPALRAHAGPTPKLVSHQLAEPVPRSERIDRCERLLDIYARAKAVVTSRVHCALPCLAIGTPVLFIPTARDLYRQSLAMELAHSCSAGAFARGDFSFDLHDPPLNPGRHEALAADLRRRCAAFLDTSARPPLD